MKHPKLLTSCFFIGVIFINTCFANDTTIIKDCVASFRTKLPPEKVPVSLQQIRFVPHKNQDFNFNMTNQYCYLIVSLQAAQSLSSYLLSVENTSLDTVLFYHLLPDGSKQLLYQGGNYIKYDPNRLYVWHTLPITIKNTPDYYLIVTKDHSKNVNLTYSITTENALQKRYRFFERLIFFYLGIITLVILASLTGFVLFKNRELLIFPCYILSVSTWIIAHYGYLYANLYTFSPLFSEIAKPVSFLLAVLFLLGLVSTMFEKELKSTKYGKLVSIFKIANLCLLGFGFIRLTPLCPFHLFTFYNIIWHVSLILSVCVVFATIIWLYKRNKTARIFLFSQCAVLGMSLYQLSANIGVFHSSFMSDHGMLLACLFLILLLMYGIFYNVWEGSKLRDLQLLQLEEEQSKALQKLIQVQERERKRIAEDLHDSIGPMLAAIKINFMRIIRAKSGGTSFTELVTKTESIIDDTITEIRAVSHQLMPKNLSSKGLITVLSEYFKNLEAIYTLTIYFTHDVTGTIPEETQLNIHRVISELVLNAARHSHSKVISVSIVTNRATIHIQVRDVGRGFNTTEPNGKSLGLKNIESRVAYMKGNLLVESSERVGTLFQISIPQ